MPLTITKLRCRSAAALLGGIFVLLIPGTDNIHAQGTSAKIDQFGSINAEDAMARLDRFALELNSHPDSRGIIVASNTINYRTPRGKFLRLAYGYRNYLVSSRGVEAERISVVEGERKPEPRFELWTLPRYELSTISEEATAPEPSTPQEFDWLPIGPETQCVGHLPMELYKLEDGLRILRAVLTNHSRAKVWIVVHARARDSQAAAQAIINRSRQLLIRDGVKAERILTAIGSPRSSTCGAVNLWIVPANSAKADEAGYYSELIREAEQNGYTMRRVEFSGNERIRDNVLRKQFVQGEGDVLSLKFLDQGLKNFTSLATLYPVTLSDVEARLYREEKVIDLTIYLRERRRR
jgi:hypothetical protein